MQYVVRVLYALNCGKLQAVLPDKLNVRYTGSVISMPTPLEQKNRKFTRTFQKGVIYCNSYKKDLCRHVSSIEPCNLFGDKYIIATSSDNSIAEKYGFSSVCFYEPLSTLSINVTIHTNDIILLHVSRCC